MRVALGDICTIRSSLVDPTLEQYRGLPHVAPDSIERDTGRLRHIRSAAADGVTSGKYQFEPGDILYSKIRPNLNKVAEIEFAGLCSADMYALDVDIEHAEPRFIAYTLRRRAFLEYAMSLSNRANIPKLNRKQVLEYAFDLPSIDEQRRVVAILDRADAVRTKRRRVIDHLGALEASLFAELVADINRHVSLREMGVDFLSGKNVLASGVPGHPSRRVIKVSAISSGRFIPSESKPMPDDYVPPESHLLRQDDILFGRASGSLDLLGATAVIDCVPENLYLPDKVWRLTVGPNAPVVARYVLGVLRSSSARAFIRHNASGAAGVRNISKSKLLEHRAPLPSLGRQKEYTSHVAKVDELRRKAQRALVADEALFASLQSRAFGGDL